MTKDNSLHRAWCLRAHITALCSPQRDPCSVWASHPLSRCTLSPGHPRESGWMRKAVPPWIPGEKRKTFPIFSPKLGPGEGTGNPSQHSCLRNPTDRGAWQATVHGVVKSRTQLSNNDNKKQLWPKRCPYCIISLD